MSTLSAGDTARLRAVRETMQDVSIALADLAPWQDECLGNALLNLAMERMIAEEGAPRAAALLWRLADAVAQGRCPSPDAPIALEGCQG